MSHRDDRGDDQAGDLPEHVRRNRAFWDQSAPDFIAAGEACWERHRPIWGIWGIPDSEIRMFPDSLAGRDVIELGCGTAYVSAWIARQGA